MRPGAGRWPRPENHDDLAVVTGAATPALIDRIPAAPARLPGRLGVPPEHGTREPVRPVALPGRLSPAPLPGAGGNRRQPLTRCVLSAHTCPWPSLDPQGGNVYLRNVNEVITQHPRYFAHWTWARSPLMTARLVRAE